MDKNDSLKLSNQLCFPLYACSKGIVKGYKPFLDKIDLTYTQYITMMVMWEHKELNVKELGQFLHLDSGTLTPVLKKLEAKGILTRKRSKEDERNLVVKITKAGEELKEKASSIPEEMGKCLSLSVEDMENLYRILYKLIDQFEE